VSAFFLPYPIGSNEPDDGRYGRERPVFAASGGAVLYRRALFDEIGLFDERFFAYFEDVDLSFRAQLAGKRFLFVPESRVLHLGAATSGGRFSPLAVRLSTRNLLFVLAKNLPAPLLWRGLPRLAAGQLWWCLKMAVKERRPGAWLRGVAAGLAGFASMRRSGRTAREVTQLSPRELADRLSISASEVSLSLRRKRERLAAGLDGDSLRPKGGHEEARA
jgi:GT2 family glycosyltransferase